MVQENEALALVLAIGALIFVVANRPGVRKLPAWPVLIGAFYAMLAAAALTVLEPFVLPSALNALEHVCGGASAVLLLAWCYLVFGSAKEPTHGAGGHR